MLLGEVGKLREERRNIQLFVEFIIPATRLSRLLTNLLAKSVHSCVCEASTKLVACSIQIGKAYHFVIVRSLCLLFVLGNRALVLLPHNHRQTCHLKSLLHPVLNPPALGRGDPFTNVVDSGAPVRNRRGARLDPSSRRQCKCNHHLGRLPTVHKLLAPGQLGKVSFRRHFFWQSFLTHPPTVQPGLEYTPPPSEPTIHLAPEVPQQPRGLFGPRSPRSS
jgi:hypothetical protein